MIEFEVILRVKTKVLTHILGVKYEGKRGAQALGLNNGIHNGTVY